jgi:hypothetical protein
MSGWPHGPRFVVVEAEGFRTHIANSKTREPGLSAMVCDEAVNGRVVRTWRTEEIHGRLLTRRERARREAARLADELNAWDADMAP